MDSKNQLILFQGNFLTHWVESNTPGTSYPTTNITDPIVVFDKQNNHISLGIDKDVPSFPTLPNLVSVENDATLAKSATAVGYAYKRKIEAYARSSEVITKAVNLLVEVEKFRIYL